MHGHLVKIIVVLRHVQVRSLEILIYCAPAVRVAKGGTSVVGIVAPVSIEGRIWYVSRG